MVLLALTFVLCAAAAEGLVRALYADSITLFPRFHARADYEGFALRRLRPNSTFRHRSPDGSWEFVTNAQGFRDFEDYTHEKPQGTVRILALGDSHTQGFEVRQDRTYAEVVERSLARRGVDAKVLNTGVSGFGTAEQLAFLESEGLRYQPDFVLVGFFANDFDDNVKAGLFNVEDGQLRIAKHEHLPGIAVLDAIHAVPGLPWLSQHSYLYSLAFNTVWNSAKRALLDRAESRLQTESAVASGELTEFKKELTGRLLERMYKVCRANGLRLILLDIPQVEGDRIRSSVPTDLEPHFLRNSDAYIPADRALTPFQGLAELHVPHGQRHISEFTHLILGMEAAEVIQGTHLANRRRSPLEPERSGEGNS